MRIDFKKYLEDYEAATERVEYRRHGIFPSEGLVFVSFCRHHDVDIVIESGTCLGYSTEIFSRSLENTKIYTIDLNWSNEGTAILGEEHIATRNKLNLLNNTEAIEGDSNQEIPKLLKKYLNKKIAIFIDGPKGWRANRLALECLKNKDVKFVGVHDHGPLSAEPDLDIGEIDVECYCTQSNQKYRYLDKRVADCEDCIVRKRRGTRHYTEVSYLKMYPKGPGLCIYYNDKIRNT